MHKYGWTEQTVSETIRICKNRDILKEYLTSREKEVVTIMMDLYDQDRILEIHIASEKKIAAEEAREAEKEAAIQRMLRNGKLSYEEIAAYQDVPVEKVREIEAEMLTNA